MSENIKAELSTFDRSIGIINTYNVYKNRKISEQILNQQYRSNAILSGMKHQLSEANITQKKILENQIKELEQKEEQKFYKSLSFYNCEIIEQLEKVNDKIVLNYILESYYEKLKSSLQKANDILDEINDKLFNKTQLDKLEQIKNNANPFYQNYCSSPFKKLDNLIADLKSKEIELNSIEKKEYIISTIKDKNKTNIGRIILIIILSFFVLSYVFGVITTKETHEVNTLIIAIIIFSIPLFFVLRKELKWRKNYNLYKQEQDLKRENEILKKTKFDKIEEDKVNSQKDFYFHHPAFQVFKEIEQNHPSFDETTKTISTLERTFSDKWNLTVENIKNEKVSEQVLEYIKTGETFKAIKTYSKENKVTFPSAKKTIEELTKNFKY